MQASQLLTKQNQTVYAIRYAKKLICRQGSVGKKKKKMVIIKMFQRKKMKNFDFPSLISIPPFNKG